MPRNNALLMSKHSEKENKWFKQQNKMIVQKGGLHFAVHRNAQKSQDDTLKNHTSTVLYMCVCSDTLKCVSVTQQ